MFSIVVGTDELTLVGCSLVINPISDVSTVDVSDGYTKLETVVRDRQPSWVVVAGRDLDLGSLVQTVAANTETRPKWVLVYSPSESGEHVKLIQDAFSMGFKAILSSESDLNVMKSVFGVGHCDIVTVTPDVISMSMSTTRQAEGISFKTPAMTDILMQRADLLRYIAHGLSNKEIAREFNVTEDHIKFRVRQTMRSLGLRKRTQLATAYLQDHHLHAVVPDDRLGPAAGSPTV